ncbi:periplasmic binding protein-like I [Catenaria anguillulae PL171]|uniref:Periplasmic binding protein-like I n=1 Tax=Catenaria anguillulae PL171 TaxID=765915 RepID=A0A1Y2HU98_9FUNG|nr:periplasmic binding protein-like I [Catenaria anguillulae PL171]
MHPTMAHRIPSPQHVRASKWRKSGRWLAVLVTMLALTTLQFYSPAHAATFNIAVMLPYLTEGLGTSVINLKKFIMANEALVQGLDAQHSFSLKYIPTNYTLIESTKAMVQAVKEHNIVGALGDWASSMTVPGALAAGAERVWMCSGAASSSQLSDKKNFGNFYRTMPSDPAQGRIFGYVIKHMGWKSVSVISSSDTYGQSVTNSFTEIAFDLGIKIAANPVFNPGQADFTVVLDAVINSGSQIVLLAALSEDSIFLIRNARARGIIGPEWVWLGPDAFSYWTDLGVTQQDIESMNGFLYIFPREQSYTALFNQSVARFNAAFPSDANLIPAYSWLFVDCLISMANGILRIVRETSAARVLAKDYTPSLQRHFLVPFEGVTGSVTFDENGDRQAVYQVFNWYNGTTTTIFNVEQDKSVTSTGVALKFFNGKSDIPSDSPKQVALVPYWTSATGVALGAVNAVIIGAIIASWAYLFKTREIPTVRSLSFPFLSLICVGCVAVLVSNMAALGQPTANSCQASLWLFVYGFELVLASSAAKAFRLWKIFENRQISAGRVDNLFLLYGVLGIMAIQTIILGVWMGIGPQQAILVSSRAFYYYRCSSVNMTTDQILSGITIAYNAILLGVCMLMAYKTRNIASNFKETSWLFYMAQNTLLSGAVVAVFAFFNLGDSFLAGFVVKQVTIIYAVTFAFAALVGRISVAVFASGGAVPKSPSLANASLMSKVEGGGPRTTASVLNMTGGVFSNPGLASSASRGDDTKSSNGVIRGTFAVKKDGSLFSTWLTSNVCIHPNEGVLTIIASKYKPELGVVLRLSSVQFDASPVGYDNCLEVVAGGKGWLVQFSSAEERDRWVSMLSSMAQSKKGTSPSSSQTSSANHVAASKK